jgi:ASC-1-like (ASCH) protein
MAAPIQRKLFSTHEKQLDEPWFTLVKLGIKTVEIRLATEANMKIYVGDVIYLTNSSFGFYRDIHASVTNRTRYATLRECLEAIGINKCVPGIDNVGEAILAYEHYYSNVNVGNTPVVAYHIEVCKK